MSVDQAGEGAKRGNAWNSLEVSKLVLSAGTPLALFLLGYIVSTSAANENRQRAAQSAEREAAAKRDALQREDAIRTDGLARDAQLRRAASAEAKQARDEAFSREKALRAEGHARELALKSLSDSREALIRTQARREARLDRLLARRFELWGEAGSLLASVRDQLGYMIAERDAPRAAGRSGLSKTRSDVLVNKTTPGEIIQAIEIASAKIEPYQSFFSEPFIRSFSQYRGAATRAAHLVDKHDRGLPRLSTEPSLQGAFDEVNDAYDELGLAVRRDLTTVQEPGSDRH